MKLSFRLITFFLLLVSSREAISQHMIRLEGKVLDGSTEEPVAYVSIFLAGTTFGTVSNHSGKFAIEYAATNNDAVIVFSRLGYKPFQMKVEEITNPFLTIVMEQQSVELNEVVVKPLDPLDIVFQSVSNFSQNYNHSSHRIRGFQRESVRQSDNYIQLLEASFETSQGIEGDRTSTVLDALYIEDKAEKDPLWSSSRGGFYTYGWTPVSGIENPIEGNFLGISAANKRDLAKYYEFQWLNPVTFEGREIYVIGFDQKKSVKRSLLKGSLYIDATSYAIVKMVYELSPTGIKHLKSHEKFGGEKISRPPKRIDISKERYEINYRKHGGKWYLHTYVMEAEFDASLVFFRMVQSQKSFLRLYSERIVTAIDTTESTPTNIETNIVAIGSIPTLQNFVKQHYENYNIDDNDKWATANFIQSDTSIAVIADALNRKNQQWESIKEHSSIERVLTGTSYSKRQLKEDLNFLQESLEAIHPGVFWYSDKSALDSAFKAVKRHMKKRNTEETFFQLISPLIEIIHCGHTRALPSVATSEYFERHSKQFPLDIWINGDSAIVIDTILNGSVIRRINGGDMSDIIRCIKQSVPSDGYNDTYKTFLLNRNFLALYAMYISQKDSFDVEMQERSGQISHAKLSGNAKNAVKLQNPGNATLSFNDSLSTALMTLPSFSNDQDLPRFFEESFNQMKNIGIKNLIIDLRNNEGGKDEYGALLFSYISNAAFTYYKNITVATMDTTLLNRLTFGDIPFNTALPDYLSSIEEKGGTLYYTAHSNLAPQAPNKNAFKGTVYILINGGTYSTASEFAAVARSNNRATFIGQETGGGYHGNCSLGTPMLALPLSKIRITVPLAKYTLNVTEVEPRGYGVKPDHSISYTLSDILGEKDRELDLCLKVIREKLE